MFSFSDVHVTFDSEFYHVGEDVAGDACKGSPATFILTRKAA